MHPTSSNRDSAGRFLKKVARAPSSDIQPAQPVAPLSAFQAGGAHAQQVRQASGASPRVSPQRLHAAFQAGGAHAQQVRQASGASPRVSPQRLHTSQSLAAVEDIPFALNQAPLSPRFSAGASQDHPEQLYPADGFLDAPLPSAPGPALTLSVHYADSPVDSYSSRHSARSSQSRILGRALDAALHSRDVAPRSDSRSSPRAFTPSAPVDESAEFHSADSGSQASDAPSLGDLEATVAAQSEILAVLVASMTPPLPLAPPPSLARPLEPVLPPPSNLHGVREKLVALGGKQSEAPWQVVKPRKASRASAPSKTIPPVVPEVAPPAASIVRFMKPVANRYDALRQLIDDRAPMLDALLAASKPKPSRRSSRTSRKTEKALALQGAMDEAEQRAVANSRQLRSDSSRSSDADVDVDENGYALEDFVKRDSDSSSYVPSSTEPSSSSVSHQPHQHTHPASLKPSSIAAAYNAFTAAVAESNKPPLNGQIRVFSTVMRRTSRLQTLNHTLDDWRQLPSVALVDQEDLQSFLDSLRRVEAKYTRPLFDRCVLLFAEDPHFLELFAACMDQTLPEHADVFSAAVSDFCDFASGHEKPPSTSPVRPPSPPSTRGVLPAATVRPVVVPTERPPRITDITDIHAITKAFSLQYRSYERAHRAAGISYLSMFDCLTAQQQQSFSLFSDASIDTLAAESNTVFLERCRETWGIKSALGATAALAEVHMSGDPLSRTSWVQLQLEFSDVLDTIPAKAMPSDQALLRLFLRACDFTFMADFIRSTNPVTWKKALTNALALLQDVHFVNDARTHRTRQRQREHNIPRSALNARQAAPDRRNYNRDRDHSHDHDHDRSPHAIAQEPWNRPRNQDRRSAPRQQHNPRNRGPPRSPQHDDHRGDPHGRRPNDGQRVSFGADTHPPRHQPHPSSFTTRPPPSAAPLCARCNKPGHDASACISRHHSDGKILPQLPQAEYAQNKARYLALRDRPSVNLIGILGSSIPALLPDSDTSDSEQVDLLHPQSSDSDSPSPSPLSPVCSSSDEALDPDAVDDDRPAPQSTCRRYNGHLDAAHHCTHRLAYDMQQPHVYAVEPSFERHQLLLSKVPSGPSCFFEALIEALRNQFHVLSIDHVPLSPALCRSMLARLTACSPFRMDQALDNLPARTFIEKCLPVTFRTASGDVVVKTWQESLCAIEDGSSVPHHICLRLAACFFNVQLVVLKWPMPSKPIYITPSRASARVVLLLDGDRFSWLSPLVARSTLTSSAVFSFCGKLPTPPHPDILLACAERCSLPPNAELWQSAAADVRHDWHQVLTALRARDPSAEHLLLQARSLLLTSLPTLATPDFDHDLLVLFVNMIVDPRASDFHLRLLSHVSPACAPTIHHTVCCIGSVSSPSSPPVAVPLMHQDPSAASVCDEMTVVRKFTTQSLIIHRL